MNYCSENGCLDSSAIESSRYCSGKLPDLTTKEYRIVSESLIFKDILPDELGILLKCLNSVKKSFRRGDYALMGGEKVTHIGVVLKGSADIVQEDALGRKNIVTKIIPGGVFGEGIAASNLAESPVSVIACEDTDILFLGYNHMIERCEANCNFHTRLIANMLELMSNKIIMLNRKLNYSLMKTIREKIVNFMIESYGVNKSKSFLLPYNREELANYFSVDRSSLSRELAKMKEEGLIEFNKNKFILFDKFFENI